jgi:hypothetical protein
LQTYLQVCSPPCMPYSRKHLQAPHVQANDFFYNGCITRSFNLKRQMMENRIQQGWNSSTPCKLCTMKCLHSSNVIFLNMMHKMNSWSKSSSWFLLWNIRPIFRMSFRTYSMHDCHGLTKWAKIHGKVWIMIIIKM